MIEVTFEINSNQYIWELFDKKLNSIYIHKFNPNQALEWWKTDLKTKSGVTYKNLMVRQMQFDIQTDLTELKKILESNTNQLRVYQFEKPISDTLDIDTLPKQSKDSILKQNGLKHFFFIDFEFVTIRSFEPEFINEIKANREF